MQAQTHEQCWLEQEFFLLWFFGCLGSDHLRFYIRPNGLIGILDAHIILMCPLLNLFCLLRMSGTCNDRYATINFVCSSTFSHLEINHTSLPLIAWLIDKGWIDTLFTKIIFRAIKKQLYRPLNFYCVFLIPHS